MGLNTYKCLKDGSQEARLFSAVPSDVTKSNGHKTGTQDIASEHEKELLYKCDRALGQAA